MSMDTKPTFVICRDGDPEGQEVYWHGWRQRDPSANWARYSEYADQQLWGDMAGAIPYEHEADARADILLCGLSGHTVQGLPIIPV